MPDERPYADDTAAQLRSKLDRARATYDKANAAWSRVAGQKEPPPGHPNAGKILRPTVRNAAALMEEITISDEYDAQPLML